MFRAEAFQVPPQNWNFADAAAMIGNGLYGGQAYG